MVQWIILVCQTVVGKKKKEKVELFNPFTFRYLRLCSHLCARCEETRAPTVTAR